MAEQTMTTTSNTSDVELNPNLDDTLETESTLEPILEPEQTLDSTVDPVLEPEQTLDSTVEQVLEPVSEPTVTVESDNNIELTINSLSIAQNVSDAKVDLLSNFSNFEYKSVSPPLKRPNPRRVASMPMRFGM